MNVGLIPAGRTNHAPIDKLVKSLSSKGSILKKSEFESQWGHQWLTTINKQVIIETCSDGEIGRHKRLKIFRSQGHAGSIPARSTKNKLKSS